MSYVVPTPEQFKIFKPQFESVPDETVQLYLDLAARVVDQSWTEQDYPIAIMAYACHLMTINGLGTSSEAQLANSMYGQFQTIKSGQLTLQRFQKAASDGLDYADWLASTSCGKFYGVLLRANRSGPRVINTSAAPNSGYAKDWPGPAYGWPGVFLSG